MSRNNSNQKYFLKKCGISAQRQHRASRWSPSEEFVTKKHTYIVHRNMVTKLSLSKLGWCGSNLSLVVQCFMQVLFPNFSTALMPQDFLQSREWTELWKSRKVFFFSFLFCVCVWNHAEQCQSRQKMLCVHTLLWQHWAVVPHGTSCSSSTCRDSFCTALLLSAVHEGMRQTSGSCLFSSPLPQCICWGSVLLWNLLIIYRYIAVCLSQGGPSQRQCLAVAAEIGVDPQFQWDFIVRDQISWKGVRLLFLSFVWVKCRPSWTTQKGSPKGRAAGRWENSSTLGKWLWGRCLTDLCCQGAQERSSWISAHCIKFCDLFGVGKKYYFFLKGNGTSVTTEAV